MTPTPASVAGDWTGVFDYGEGFDEAVAFTAMLFDVGGAIWGTSDEPNSIDPAVSGYVLTAQISGRRSGREVTFTKTYDGPPIGGEFPITYAGLLSADNRRIEGRWSIPAYGSEKSGPFVMNRKPGITVVRAGVVKLVEEVRL